MIEVKQLNTRHWDLCQSPFLRSMQCVMQARQKRVNLCCRTITTEPGMDTLLRRYVRILPNFQPIQPLVTKLSLQAAKTSPSLLSRTLRPRWLHEPTSCRCTAQPSKTKILLRSSNFAKDEVLDTHVSDASRPVYDTVDALQNVGKGFDWTSAPWLPIKCRI